MAIATARMTELPKHDYEVVPEGDYFALCYQIIDVGTQMTIYDGVSTPKNQILFGFELHSQDTKNPVLMSDGRPYAVTYKDKGKLLTLSFNSKANLRKMLSAWRGKPIDDSENPAEVIKSFLGKPCLMSITHYHYTKDGQEKVSLNMTAPARVPPVLQPLVPKMVNAPVYFDCDKQSWDEQTFQNLKGLPKKLIEESEEFRNLDAFISPQKSTSKLTPINPKTGLPVKKAEELVSQEVPFEDEIPF